MLGVSFGLTSDGRGFVCYAGLVNRYWKQLLKQAVRSGIGEPYVGKRLKQIRVGKELSALDLRPREILDAGTEDATFVYWLADRYPTARVTAVDIDEDAIAACLEARPTRYEGRVSFKAIPFASLPDDKYDLVTVFDVLEHIADDRDALDQLIRSLRPGGVLLVHVPRDQWTTRPGEIQVVPDSEAWKINPGHVRMGYSPEAMRTLLSDGGLNVEDIQTWVGPRGVLAHSIYSLLEHPAPLRLLSIPVTEWAARTEAPTSNGNTVFARAAKSG